MSPSATIAKDVTYLAEGSETSEIDESRASRLLEELLSQLGSCNRVLLLPPDHSRLHSWAGPITRLLYEKLSPHRDVFVMPAVGTHLPMSRAQRDEMFGDIPESAFLDHRWKEGLVRLGEVDEDFVEQASEGTLRMSVPIEINRILVEGGWDRIFSIGQLVPHEVIGIANHVKNVLIGVGGRDTIHRSHYLGAVYGMERIMGQIDSPVRTVLQEGMNRFGASLPITYVLTVRGEDAGRRVTRGLYAGDGVGCYEQGARLAQRANIVRLPRRPRKMVVLLDEREYASTWIGNKAIYRTRMAIADGGELIVLAPGVRMFGEDVEIDRLIRAFGYRGTEATKEAVASKVELRSNLAAAAHLIHGSSEGRFSITYAPGHLTREEIERVGFRFGEVDSLVRRYDPARLTDGWNDVAGEEIYFVRHPGQGLWMANDAEGKAG
jgi:nickel-dependent lactate racemase